MTDGLRFPELCVPTVSRQPALILRPWRAADIPALAAEMSREYPTAGMWSRPDERPVRTALPARAKRRTGPIDERETADFGYWTAVAARGRGIAPAAVRAVTDWVFDAFAGASLRQIMLVHDVGNPASCRVAEKAGYPFRELSPANPPHWFTSNFCRIFVTVRALIGPAGGLVTAAIDRHYGVLLARGISLADCSGRRRRAGPGPAASTRRCCARPSPGLPSGRPSWSATWTASAIISPRPPAIRTPDPATAQSWEPTQQEENR